VRPALLALALSLTACQGSLNVFPADAGPSCAEGRTVCGGQCVDVRLDSSNCGRCGASCSSAQACGGGECHPKDCIGFTCGATQVCPGSSACVERACVGVSCGAAEVCLAGACQPSACGATTCPAGLACVDGACVDVNCTGVICPVGARCAGGACVKPGAAGAVSGFSSGASLGAEAQRNDTHVNRAVLGEPTPPVEGVRQGNGTHTNQAGSLSGL
jgi:hypothetical protein